MKNLVDFVKESYKDDPELKKYLSQFSVDDFKKWDHPYYLDKRHWLHEESYEHLRDIILLEENKNRREIADKLRDALIDKFQMNPCQVQINRLESHKKFKDCIIWVGVFNKQNCDAVSEIAYAYGFFECNDRKTAYMEEYGRTFVQLTFEPLFEEDCTDEIIRHTDVLYHFAPQNRVDAINKEGLVPRNENSIDKYPPRIFMVLGDTPEHLIIALLNNLRNKNNKGVSKYAKYSINIRDLKQKIYFDPDNPHSVYVEKTVKPELLHLKDNDYKFECVS